MKKTEKKTETKETKIDVGSIENQDIKGQFVAREVKACFSYEMDEILKVSSEMVYKNELPKWDDIENLYEYKCPDCGEGYATEDEAKECCNSDKEIESEPQEIFEWWIVSEFLYKKLQSRNHPVIEWGNNYYWGRCKTGQAILLDGVISNICKEMEILDGQKYSWAKK